ncbi:GGDEF domain-containing protein [Desulfosporosinus sp.]|uniref:GGDEF domain-containing protein n=1 Tax=Desulfosporosinus sp. TaxID=157907 RepID=UPI002316C2AE|nr:GGDEF domain-containing protein [Desulfosporosinus sp.]MCO5384929.1 GGDEF domain-containing protein [Desulfosporosinus sp.]MDA8222567.1 GGDEF domain-containing protein [Desulfitobacterium hafniense]
MQKPYVVMWKVTISLGAAIGHANPANPPTILVEAADTALYQANQDGRNRIKLAKHFNG